MNGTHAIGHLLDFRCYIRVTRQASKHRQLTDIPDEINTSQRRSKLSIDQAIECIHHFANSLVDVSPVLIQKCPTEMFSLPTSIDDLSHRRIQIESVIRRNVRFDQFI